MSFTVKILHVHFLINFENKPMNLQNDILHWLHVWYCKDSMRCVLSHTKAHFIFFLVPRKLVSLENLDM